MESIVTREIIEGLENESDVEQKLIYPILTRVAPFGLGYKPNSIYTKKDIRKFDIDKGSSKKQYFPDYIVVENSFPVLIVEAKTPSESMEKSYREARLYATELNASYPSGLNPCRFVIGCNGKELWVGYSDSEKPIYKALVQEGMECLEDYNNIREFCQREQASNYILSNASNCKLSKFFKPVHMLGSGASIDSKIPNNSFGMNLSLEYKSILNPENSNEREEIVLNAYVESKRRETHITHIERIIKNSKNSNKFETIVIDTLSADKVTTNLNNPKFKKEIFLIVGHVGSGKSTFVDYLRYVELTSKEYNFSWVNINLNNSPSSRNLIYEWIINQTTSQISEVNSSVDFSSLEFIEKIFSSEIAKFKSGPIKIFDKDSEKYKVEYFNELNKLQGDSVGFLKSIIDYFYTSRNLTLVVTLDNCDKREKESQLLMFEVANWLKNEFSCNVILPIRDTTFEIYQDQPPLDTVIKDLVFRIDPPQLQRVLKKRLKYIAQKSRSFQSDFTYQTYKGMSVKVSRDEVYSYLNSIVNSIFNNQYYKTIVIGLTGKNIRRGIEIILDFCKSGYLKEDEILKMRMYNDNYEIPNHRLSLILLKGNRNYYSDSNSKIRNLFNAYEEEVIPDPFARISILLWLKENFKISGQSNVRGFHNTGILLNELVVLGHNRNNLLRELEELLKSDCITSEGSLTLINEGDYVSISSAGFSHLSLLKNISYLSTVCEDILFKQNQTARLIADNIVGRGNFLSNSKLVALDNAKTTIDYLIKYHEENFSLKLNIHDQVLSPTLETLMDIKMYLERKTESDSEYNFLRNANLDFKKGDMVLATVSGIKDYGVFVEFDGYVGFISRESYFGFKDYIDDNLDVGETIVVKVIKFDSNHKKFSVVIEDV